jgi:hypothetical protein
LPGLVLRSYFDATRCYGTRSKSRGIRILNLSCKCSEGTEGEQRYGSTQSKFRYKMGVVSVRLWLIYPWETNPALNEQEAGLGVGSVSTCYKG